MQGLSDQSELTDLGKGQAAQVGDSLASVTFDAVYASPLQRARQTAEIICDRIQTHQGSAPALQPRNDLVEISLPDWEGMAFDDIARQFPDQYDTWRNRPHELVMAPAAHDPNAQALPPDLAHRPVAALYHRAATVWQKIRAAHPGQTVLIVAHSAINRALVSTAIGLKPHQFTQLDQTNCSISVLNFPAEADQLAQLESMNLTAHTGQPIPARRSRYTGPRLLLVRHGETDWNREGRFQGQIDVPLNDNGRAQGQRAAEFLKPIPIDAAVSSTMARPKETAEIILQHHPGLDLGVDPQLQEISHGEWEGRYEPDIEAHYPGLLHQWQTAPETVQMPAGENLQQVWDRAVAAWDTIVKAHDTGDSDTAKTVLVVAHDAINKAILCYVTGLGPSAFWRFKQGNGAVSVIDYPKGAGEPAVLAAANITTHLGAGVLDSTAAGAL